ncbi:MAG TPA: hypothetical protein PKO41_08570 [Dokdonella sp.]|uniref:hypothetical protein n=1 Tax=Dokdonella sp. TaxID=2291710 RepID=UPI0025C38510|nr:hypothetical protein [Dokdonella sp.]MBX3692480.1 hypothetical protein [Dokdonella sp.]MCW5567573.1 hypothetical protein [Dokdonella sp.]HNR92465.1 hypothetical protein [Dokdonella sp.]
MRRTTRIPTKLRRFALAALPLLVVAPALAWANIDLKLSLVATSMHAPQAPPDLRIEATWPNTCLPAVEAVTIVPGHIDVHLRQPGTRCTVEPTAFAVEVNPARASGWSHLPRDVYAVRLFLAGAGSSGRLIAFRWLDAAADNPATPESGFWWSVANQRDGVAELIGSGISLERQGERIAVTLFGYDAGRPEWAFGSGVLRGSVAHVQLMRMRGGNAPFTPGVSAPIAEPGPALHLHFASPAQAEAWIERDLAESDLGIELQPLALARSTFSTARAGSAWQGRWVLIGGVHGDARVMQFNDAASTSDADGFRLLDNSFGAELDCRLDDGPAAFPRRCTLRIDGRSATHFDRIGLDRLQGRDGEGRVAELIRLPE